MDPFSFRKDLHHPVRIAMDSSESWAYVRSLTAGAHEISGGGYLSFISTKEKLPYCWVKSEEGAQTVLQVASFHEGNPKIGIVIMSAWDFLKPERKGFGFFVARLALKFVRGEEERQAMFWWNLKRSRLVLQAAAQSQQLMIFSRHPTYEEARDLDVLWYQKIPGFALELDDTQQLKDYLASIEGY